MRLLLAALLAATAVSAAPKPPAPSGWRPWVDRLAAALADPALPQLDATQLAPFFRGVVDLPPEVGQCRDLAGYTPPAGFATAVATALIPPDAPCARRRFGRIGFAVDGRTDADTDALVSALTAKLGAPATENVWFPKPGGQVSALRHAWQMGSVNVVVLLEPDESHGLVGVSVVRGSGPSPIPPPKAHPPAPDSFEAMVSRMFQ